MAWSVTQVTHLALITAPSFLDGLRSFKKPVAVEFPEAATTS
jgi:hypothetical protein